MANVDTTKVLSDPFKTNRILYVINPFLDDFLNKDVKEKFPKTSYKRKAEEDGVGLEDILQSSILEIPKSSGALERDNLYMQEFSKALHQFKEEFSIKYFYPIFIIGVSPDNTEVGIPGRVGYDFASQLNALSTEILKMAVKSPEAYTGIIFWPISVLDIPYVYDSNENKLKPLLPDVFETVNKDMIKKDKKGFGTLEKSLDSDSIIEGTIGNYQFSEGLFDFGVFKGIVKSNPSIYKEKIEEFGEEKFFKLAHYHIFLNNILMVEKYVKLAQILNLKKIVNDLTENKFASGIPLYAIKGSYATNILRRTTVKLNLKLDIIGDDEEGGILKNVDGPTEMGMRELHPSALRSLNGRIASIYSKRTGKFNKVKIEKRKIIMPKLTLGSCLNYDFFLCEEGCRERETLDYCTCHMIDEFIKKDPEMKKALELLQIETKKDNYGLQPIESYLVKLNNRDLEVVSDQDKRFSFIKLMEYFNNPKIVPLTFNDAYYDRYDLRASEFSSNCNIERIIDKIDEDSLPKELTTEIKKEVIAEKALIGILTHVLMNQQPPQWKRFIHNEILREIGINPVRRENYCEKSIIYDYKGIKISGHPDVVVEFDENDQLMVLDIKHKIFSSSEKEKIGYIYQTLAYSFGIRQRLDLHQQYSILGLIERPFVKPEENQTSLFDIKDKIIDTGVRKQQKISLWILKDNSAYVTDFHEEIVNTYNRQRLILNNKKALLDERDKQGDNCYKCPAKNICSYLIEEVEKTNTNLIEVIPGKYPTTKQRSKLF